MRIFWSALAFERLQEIFDYISKDDLDAAHKLINKIFNRVESLTKNPERGRIVPESNRKDIREVFQGEYRIIYRIDFKHIFILTIRNFKQLLPGKDLE